MALDGGWLCIGQVGPVQKPHEEQRSAKLKYAGLRKTALLRAAEGAIVSTCHVKAHRTQAQIDALEPNEREVAVLNRDVDLEAKDIYAGLPLHWQFVWAIWKP